MSMKMLEYYGQKLYLSQIARKEDLVASTLMKCYRETGNIYVAVERCKQISKPKGYIYKIEYYEEMLTLHSIAEMEEISEKSLKRYYLELGDIYEAVKVAKQKVKGEVRRIPYNNKKLSITAIAKLEGIGPGALRKNYLKTEDIHEAVKVTKKNARVKLEYNGEMLTLNAISKKEELSSDCLTRIYLATLDIYEAVQIAKTTPNIRTERIQRIEYNGERITLEQIAQKEGIDYDSLRKYYKKTQDIYEAVQICFEDLSRKVKKIEYKNGEMLPISVIAKREGINIIALTKCYNEVGNIFEAIRICKENAQNRKIKAEQRKQKEEKGKILYKGMLMQLKEIAQAEGIDTKKLKNALDVIPDIYKAVFMLRYQKRKNENVDLKGISVDLYDMSLLIGVRYTDLINMLNAGITINDIKEKYSNKEIAGENIRLRSGRTLLEFCINEDVNFAFAYRAINTYEKLVSKVATEYKTSLGMIPIKWILEKYDKKLSELDITGFQATIIIKDLQDKKLDFEEALEKFIVRKKALQNQMPFEWCETIFALAQTRKILGEDFQSEIQLDEIEKAFIEECEIELLELKRKCTGRPELIHKIPEEIIY